MQLRNEVQPPRSPWLRARSTGGSQRNLGQRSIVLAAFAAVISLDQMVKWWAWRSVSTACINQGGDVLVGAKLSDWFADPVQGSLLDLLSAGLLSFAVFVLWRRRHSLPVLIPGCMMVAGWTSNLLDRLGMHEVTAPGSPRGAVDFLPIGGHYYNLADFFIVAGTPLLVVAVSIGVLAGRAGKGRRTREGVTSTTEDRRLMPTGAPAADAA